MKIFLLLFFYLSADGSLPRMYTLIVDFESCENRVGKRRNGISLNKFNINLNKNKQQS